ncbi:AAA family ATPase [Pseudomonas sp. ZS1P83]
MKKHLYSFKDIPLIIPEKYDHFKNSYTILVGNNGVGKSRLLNALSRSLIQKTPHHNPGNPSRFTNILNLHSIAAIQPIPSPSTNLFQNYYSIANYATDNENNSPKVITVSTSPFDAFKLESITSDRKGGHDSNYRYIGMRGANSNSSASISLINSASSGLLEKLRFNNTFERLNKVFNVLQFDPTLEFTFKPMYQKIHGDTYGDTQNLTYGERLNLFQPDQAHRFLHTFSLKRMENIESRLGIKVDSRIYSGLTDLPESALSSIRDSLSIISEFFSDGKHFRLKASYENQWTYSFNGQNSNNEKILNAVHLLLKYDLLKLMDLKLSKPSNPEISLRRASSGEQCMLVIMLGIAGHITDHSSIFIDEPEISLHPQWQEKFMSLLIEVFSPYAGCNFYIATHSPQIISKLSEENCFITSLTKKEIFHASDYRERSADFQLAEIFDTPGAMNEYLIRLAFGLISRIKSTKKVSSTDLEEIYKLQTFVEKLEPNDPLLELIKTVCGMSEYYAVDNQSL